MALNAIVTPFPADFEVWEVTFSDRLNQPFELVVRGASRHPDIDLRALLGHRITVSLPDERLLPTVNGIVNKAIRGTPEPSGVTVYELWIAPPEWVLTKRKNSRIFQKQNATAILAAVLREHAVTSHATVFTRALAEREYCVQYDETDSDFLHRLLAEEGIAAYFDHGNDGRFTMVDDTTIQKPAEASDLFVRVNSANMTPGGLAILSFRTEHRLATVAVARRDYDYGRPDLRLERAESPFEKASPSESNLEVYEYEPDRLLRSNDGGREVERDLEAMRAEAVAVEMETSFVAGAGGSLHVVGEELAGDWLVVAVSAELKSARSSGDGEDHRRIRLRAIPLGTPFRPEPRKRPLIFGAQSARVVGASAPGTVDVDDLGRICLELRWDRRDLWSRGEAGKENPTRRVRVAQAWAGPGYGIVTVPRIGDEVLVAYEDGNPDRPVVVGRMHNAVSRTPLAGGEDYKHLSIWKSQSFGPNGPQEGFNLIYMDDTAGAEALVLRAQRDMVTEVLKDSRTQINGNEDVQVTGGQSIGTGGGQSTSVGGTATLNAQDILATAQGVYSATGKYVSVVSGGGLVLTAVGERTDVSYEKHHFESPAMFFHAANGVQVLTAKCHIQTESELVLQCKGSIIRITPGAINITSPGPVEINGTPIKLNC
ncbi:MAG: type VI secretion system tip protein TssI/VgrG [Polyangiaceae bacterium]